MRKQLQEGFDEDKVTTRLAYFAVEHEWMHLETLAYMLAQEQRLSFERTATAANGHTPQLADSKLSMDSSSDDEMLSNGHKLNGHVMSHAATAHEGTNEVPNISSHDGCYDGVEGLGPADGDHTNGDSHIQPSSGCGTQSVGMLEIPAGDITLGTDMDPSINFVWDNEGPKQAPQHVSSFQMASRPVSNAEFYSFAVKSKGYELEEFWMPEDLACLRTRKQSCPATWTVQVLPCLTVSLRLCTSTKVTSYYGAYHWTLKFLSPQQSGVTVLDVR